jgi:hypothetical protein
MTIQVIDGFVGAKACAAMIAHHQDRGRADPGSDNTLDARGSPEAMAVMDRVLRMLPAHAAFDCAFLCAVHPGGFTHRVHADNARLRCKVHGADQGRLLAECTCEDVDVLPNHTPWRKWTALLYLSEVRGGLLMFHFPHTSQGVEPKPGRLVISPSDHKHFHSTTPVLEGVRYSLNSWFR